MEKTNESLLKLDRETVVPLRAGVCSRSSARKLRSLRDAFTLIELLIVIGIIGIISALVAPIFKSWNSGDALSAANRQLLDDFGLARTLALSTRSTVYVLFVPPSTYTFTFYAKDGAQLTNLFTKPYTTYALYADRSIGDQPGFKHPRYLTDWRTLPDRTLILPAEFLPGGRLVTSGTFPFPNVNSLSHVLPYVAFNSQGQVMPPPGLASQDFLLYVTLGTVSAAIDPTTGAYLAKPVAPLESPRYFSTNSGNAIRINWLTGRGVIQQIDIGNITNGVATGIKL